MIGHAWAVEPDLGPNVRIYEPGAATAQAELDAIFATQESGQFNANRYAILLKPGRHELNIQVGFYTHVLGLGAQPGDVEVVGGLDSKARWMRNRNATCNFWRAAENLTVTPRYEGGVSTWAVSQGSALRRVHVKGDVHLSDGGWSSGGFLADALIDGTIDSGTQQQWFSRNSVWRQWRGGNWNMMFLGVEHAPEGAWPERPYTTIERTPIVREKPFLGIRNGQYVVFVPGLRRDQKGISWGAADPHGEYLPIERFHIAIAGRDTAESINSALEAGKNVLFTPGVYPIDRPIRVTRADTVVLGIGYPTLVAQAGTTVLRVANVGGVKIAGVMIDAGEMESRELIEIGDTGRSEHQSTMPESLSTAPEGGRVDGEMKLGSSPHSNAGQRETDLRPSAENPICLWDIFCRAGGMANGRCRVMMMVNASHVVAENLWLWRADHGAGAAWDSNRNATGLVVNGDDVTMYGLFVEHGQEYQTIWNGERGRVYFYQSEMPYDPPSPEVWMNGSTRGFASYKVADHVQDHQATGLGVYCVFWAAPIIADRAIEAPDHAGIRLANMIAVRLNGKPESGIARVLNERGEPVIHSRVSRLLRNK